MKRILISLLIAILSMGALVGGFSLFILLAKATDVLFSVCCGLFILFFISAYQAHKEIDLEKE